MQQNEMDTDAAVRAIDAERANIKAEAQGVRSLIELAKMASMSPREGENRGEMIANLTLAYRHLEDASMRLGKAIQARDGGTSVYDKATTVGA